MPDLNSSGFKDFYTAYYKRCFLFAKSYVHDNWVAEDIASGALIKLWEMTQTENIDNPRIILFTILKNRALDYLKHEVIKQNVLTNLTDIHQRELEIRISTLEVSDPQKIFASDIQSIIHTSLSSLPTQTQQIFEMNYFRNMPKTEIAAYFGITVKGVDYHISRALACLRENLKDYFPILLFFFF